MSKQAKQAIAHLCFACPCILLKNCRNDIIFQCCHVEMCFPDSSSIFIKELHCDLILRSWNKSFDLIFMCCHIFLSRYRFQCTFVWTRTCFAGFYSTYCIRCTIIFCIIVQRCCVCSICIPDDQGLIESIIFAFL